MFGGNNNHTRTFALLRGGLAIHNPLSDSSVAGGAYGTIGFIGTSDGEDRWVVSCYHVLCRKGEDFPKGANEPIFHPVSQIRPSPVGFVTDERVDRALDCAAARVINPALSIGQLLGAPLLEGPIEAQVGMRVIKSGAETGVTEGRITRVVSDQI